MKSRKISAVLFSALLIAALLPLFSSVGDSNPGEITVTKGESTDFGGGNYVEVKRGSTGVGVLYGTSARPNHIIIYSFGERTVGEIKKFDGSRLVKKETVNTETLITEEITDIIEFRDINNNSRFDSLIGRNGEYNLTGLDYPVGGISLRRFSEAFPKISEVSNKEISVSFKLVLFNPTENLQWNDVKGKMIETDGRKIANLISVSFRINFTYGETEIESPAYTVSGNSPKYHGEISIPGIESKISVEYSYNISGWNFRYPDSKLFIETREGIFSAGEGYGTPENGVYVNVTTSNPRYLELNGSQSIEKRIDMYGHGFRIFMGDRKIGTFTGDPLSVVNGTNRSYVSILVGQHPGTETFSGKIYEGFILNSTETYWQGNMRCTKRISLSYGLAHRFVPVEAAPSWSNILPFEAASIAVLGLYLSRKRYG